MMSGTGPHPDRPAEPDFPGLGHGADGDPIGRADAGANGPENPLPAWAAEALRRDERARPIAPEFDAELLSAARGELAAARAQRTALADAAGMAHGGTAGTLGRVWWRTPGGRLAAVCAIVAGVTVLALAVRPGGSRSSAVRHGELAQNEQLAIAPAPSSPGPVAGRAERAAKSTEALRPRALALDSKGVLADSATKDESGGAAGSGGPGGGAPLAARDAARAPDIVDVMLLARALRAGRTVPNSWDIDGSGAVDADDVRALGEQVVRLEPRHARAVARALEGLAAHGAGAAVGRSTRGGEG